MTPLERYYKHVAAQPCVNCGTYGVEIAHIRGFRSDKTGEVLPRRKGIARFCAIPLCPMCHRLGPNSIHNLGERVFFQRLDQPGSVFVVMAQLIAEAFSEES